MDEIAQQFKEELQELQERLERILNNAVHNLAEDHLQQIISSGPSFLEQHALNKDFYCAHPPVTKKWSSEYNTLQGEFKYVDSEMEK